MYFGGGMQTMLYPMLKCKGTLPFLDVLLCRNGRELTTTVYRKKTNNDIYLNWNTFAPASWKRRT